MYYLADVKTQAVPTTTLLVLAVTWLIGRVEAMTHMPSIAFIHATVIDATGSPATPDTTVVVTGDRITALGRAGKVTIPEGARVIESTGKFIVPGLWDMHVHLGSYIGGKGTLARLAEYGVTGVRDMASPPDDVLRLRQDTWASGLGGSRIVAAGPILQRPLPFKLPPLVRTVASAAEARNAVDELHREGVDFVKVGDTLERAPYFAVADESKRLRIPFAGHLPVVITASEASRAGQRSIEHFGSANFQGVLIACSTDERALETYVQEAVSVAAGGGPSPDAKVSAADFLNRLVDTYDTRKASALFSLFAKNDTWNVPTLVAVRSVIDSHRNSTNASDAAAAERVWAKDVEMLSAMRHAGVNLLAGSDVPFGAGPPPLDDELVMLVEAGLTPMQALQTATRNPAIFLGRLSVEGTIARGKLANLVILNGDPLTDIANIKQVNAVVQSGRLIQRGDSR